MFPCSACLYAFKAVTFQLPINVWGMQWQALLPDRSIMFTNFPPVLRVKHLNSDCCSRELTNIASAAHFQLSVHKWRIKPSIKLPIGCLKQQNVVRIKFWGFLVIGKTENCKLCTCRRQSACGSMCGRRHATYATGLCLIVAAGQSGEQTRARAGCSRIDVLNK